MNICTECSHHLLLTYTDPPLQHKHCCVLTARVSPIDGSNSYRSCESERVNTGSCGPTGGLWEALAEADA